MQRWLDDVNKRYGGVDSMLMWPTCEYWPPSSDSTRCTPSASLRIAQMALDGAGDHTVTAQLWTAGRVRQTANMPA